MHLIELTAYHDISQVSVQNAHVFVVALVDLCEVCTEVPDNCVVLVGAVTVGSYTADPRSQSRSNT